MGDSRGSGWVGGWVGVLESVGGRSGPLTPHLASPLEGGRDELGRRDELGEEEWIGGEGAVFGFVRGVPEWGVGTAEGLTRGLTLGVSRWRVRLRLCCVLLGFGVGAGVDNGQFCQLLSTFVTVWSVVGESVEERVAHFRESLAEAVVTREA